MFNWLSGERGTRPMELSLVEGGEVLYLPNCQTNLVIALYTLSLLFCKFVNTVGPVLTEFRIGRMAFGQPSLKAL